MRWCRPKNPQNWVDWMWYEHPWRMRKARIKYELRVLYWRVFHPIQMWRNRH